MGVAALAEVPGDVVATDLSDEPAPQSVVEIGDEALQRRCRDQHAGDEIGEMTSVLEPVGEIGQDLAAQIVPRGGGALLERIDRQPGKALTDDMARRASQHLAVKALRIVTVEDREFHLPTRDRISRLASIFCANVPEVHARRRVRKAPGGAPRRSASRFRRWPVRSAFPPPAAENRVYAPENCRVGIKNRIEISLLNASGRADRQRKLGACCAGRQRTGSGIQRYGLGLLNSACHGASNELIK